MSSILQVSHLSKQFKDIRAVDDLSFSVNEGEVYGFLGQNGAGKSTTIRMLLTLVKPTSGHIEIFGMNLNQHRREILRQVGAIIEKPDLYKYLSALDNMHLFAVMSGITRSRAQLMEQLAVVGLAERAHSKVKTFSQGMKQRLGIAVALVHDPAFLILDEPINGLDPQGIAEIRKLIIHLSKEQNKTILISSHLLGEMELIADSMLIIDKGRKLAEGKVQELFNPSDTLVELQTTNMEQTIKLLSATPMGSFIHEKKENCLLLKLNKDQVPWLAKELVRLGIDILSLHARHSLEDYFLSLTGDQAHVETTKH
jgi:ABC-type multidrug transport system ATPase subunit